ncbi:hypothetical protein N566_04630 [Streptomycetaceae bacterium MP113-05]|nr:hypothetical protein N566_04630 [Streptomycetaceae bacterium MP113-05]
MRAVAVGSVLAYHAGVPLVSGGYIGVDVFFVISGFLITGLLVRELESSGTISLTGFYARRARRLLPSSVAVLLAVALLAGFLMSPVERRSVAADLVAAALYVVNWQQASLAVDYSAMGADASPVQHFWSLAVEEQFYLVWPLVLLAVVWGCRKRGGRAVRPRLAAALATIAVVSFAYSVHLTQTEAGAAYFSTLTRGWELAAGGLLALAPATRLRRLVRLPGVLAAAGLAAVVISVVLYSDTTPFPGSAAAFPVLGAVAFIAAGAASQETAAARLLGTRPMRYVGRISYSWYLWHWPAVAFAAVAFPGISTTQMVLVVAASWVPAALSHRFVEEPVRRSRFLAPVRPGLALGAACTAVGVALGALTWVTVPTMARATPAQAEGAAALQESTGIQQSASVLRPLPEEANADEGRVYESGCHAGQRDTEAEGCLYGNKDSSTTVVLFGDSHAAQYAPALVPLAEERGWRLLVLTKSACTPARTTIYNRQYERAYTECDAWRKSALERIAAAEPSLVLVGNKDEQDVMRDGGRLGDAESAAAMKQGLVATLEELKGTGAQVRIFGDVPYPSQDTPSCVSASPGALADCAFPLDEGLSYERVGLDAAEKAGVGAVDPVPVLCPEGICPAVIGNVIVYRHDEHITATYMGTLTDWLSGELPEGF